MRLRREYLILALGYNWRDGLNTSPKAFLGILDGVVRELHDRLNREHGSVERFFGAHARDYSKSGSHAHGADLAALLQDLKPKSTDSALDVATGTGFTALSLAKLVKSVKGIDVTGEMLGEARRLAESEGLDNIEFELGDAMKMKFDDASFDIVTTRRATHHFKDVPRFLHEARWVLKPGGRLCMVAMSPPDGAETFFNNIEILRDNSHVWAFTPNSWKSMMASAKFRISSLQVLGEQVSFEKWLSPVEPGGSEEKAVRAAWASASTKVKRLLHAEIEDGDIKNWTKSRIVLVASKPRSEQNRA